MTPKTKAMVGDRLYFTRTTWADRCRGRNELLNATAEDLMKASELMDRAFCEGGLCVVGGQQQLDKCPDLQEIITL